MLNSERDRDIAAAWEYDMKTIGIDIGTTTISAVALDNRRETPLASRTVSSDSFIRTEYEWEKLQDIEMIIKKAKTVLDELLALYPDVVSVGLTGQMHGILYVDGEGNAVSPLYTWQDQRGNLPVFEGKSAADAVKEQCGMTVPAGYGLMTHLYNLKKGEVPAEAVFLCTAADYFGMKLTGEKRPLLHVSMAASLGFFDCEKNCFMKEKLRQMKVDTSVLPEVTEDTAVLGSYKGRNVTVSLGDNQAGFLGAAGQKENTLLVNVGTGGQISLLSDRFFETEGIETRPFIKGKYILVGSSLCGGRAYAVLEKFFREYAKAAGVGDVSQYGLMEKLGWEAYGNTDPVKVRTTFNGTRQEPDLRGIIGNLGEDNFTAGSFVCGVLDGIARELYVMFEKIHLGTGIEVENIIGSGNGIRKNALLLRIFEDIFCAPIHMARYEEEAACGAAVSAFLL